MVDIDHFSVLPACIGLAFVNLLATNSPPLIYLSQASGQDGRRRIAAGSAAGALRRYLHRREDAELVEHQRSADVSTGGLQFDGALGGSPEKRQRNKEHGKRKGKCEHRTDAVDPVATINVVKLFFGHLDHQAAVLHRRHDLHNLGGSFLATQAVPGPASPSALGRATGEA